MKGCNPPSTLLLGVHLGSLSLGVIPLMDLVLELRAIGRAWAQSHGLASVSDLNLELHDWTHRLVEETTGMAPGFSGSVNGHNSEAIVVVFVNPKGFTSPVEMMCYISAEMYVTLGHTLTMRQVIKLMAQGQAWREANPELVGYLRA